MVLCKWDDLPEHMRCDEVKEYYDILSSRKGSLIAKRLFDFVVSLLMTIVISPILLILIILIKVDDRSSGTNYNLKGVIQIDVFLITD